MKEGTLKEIDWTQSRRGSNGLKEEGKTSSFLHCVEVSVLEQILLRDFLWVEKKASQFGLGKRMSWVDEPSALHIRPNSDNHLDRFQARASPSGA